MGKVDLVMWTKNGGGTLPFVLPFIDLNVPERVVGQKIAVDDCSQDDSREILERHGWRVVDNRGCGISDGANTALGLVETEVFASFEQDVLLCEGWWRRVSPLLADSSVAVASGVRVPSKPVCLATLQAYTTLQYQQKTGKSAFLFGKTLDNTLYRADVLRGIGGFPKLDINAGVDTALAVKLLQRGYRWVVDFDVKSFHLREGLLDELRHYFWYGKCLRGLRRSLGGNVDGVFATFLRTCFSPVRGLDVAFKTRCPAVAYVYPQIRLASFFGMVRGYLS